MSWGATLHRLVRERQQAIGPGRLVLVVGPSGAGKDTLIAHAQSVCRNDPDVVFPRRVVTRPASSAEDNDTLSAEDFVKAAADGAFALWWRAHGHHYGIPASIDADIGSGRVVVCNVSRAIIPVARERYAGVSVVLVTAPAEVLAVRLAARARSSDGALAGRLARAAATTETPDIVIENVGEPLIGARMLVDAIYGRSLTVAL